MKTFRIALIIIAAVLADRPAFAEYWDESLGLYFPDSVAQFPMLSRDTFGAPELGYCVGYKSSKEGLVSFYVYNNGLSQIPQGGDSKEVRKEFADVVGNIPTAWKTKGYEVKTLVETKELKSAEGKVIALESVHQITSGDESLISITILTAYKNNFLKIRYSATDSDSGAVLQRIGMLGKAFGEYNEKLVKALTDGVK